MKSGSSSGGSAEDSVGSSGVDDFATPANGNGVQFSTSLAGRADSDDDDFATQVVFCMLHMACGLWRVAFEYSSLLLVCGAA